MNDRGKITHFVALRPIEDQGVSIDSCPHYHLSADRSERQSNQFRGNVWSAVVGCLDRDHSYILVAN